MNNIQLLQYNDSRMEFEVIDGQVFANATIMCQAFGKRPVNWLDLTSTKTYINALKAKSEIMTLVETRQGGANAGTWIHEKLILKLSAWLDTDFEIWCDEKIAELLKTGKVEIQPVQLSTLDIIRIAEQSELGRLKALEDNAILAKQLEANAPKIEYLEKVLSSKDTMVTTVIAGDLGMSAIALNRRLKDMGIQRKVGGQWQLTAKYCNMGYATTKIHTHTDKDGNVHNQRLLVWTETGKAFLHKQFNTALSYSKITPQLSQTLQIATA